MTPEKHNEGKVAEALAAFTDELNAGRAVSIEEFLKIHSKLTAELRPLLVALLELRRKTYSMSLTKPESDRIFTEIKRRMNETQSTAGVMLDSRRDFLILLLHTMKRVWNIDVWGSTKLVKLLYLLGKEGKCDQFVPDYYSYYAHSYGAFDRNVPQDTAGLFNKGIIKISPPSRNDLGAGEELGIPAEKCVNAVYRLTPKGVRCAEALTVAANKQDPEILKRIIGIVKRYGKKTTDELLEYTYNTYPETATHSKVKDKYLRSASKDTHHDN